MATVLFLNNYQTTLGAALSSTATTMTVSSTTGLPSSLASGQFIPMTLTPASSPGSAYEIVYVTGISGSTLTVERGQEGTSALNWNTGDILYSTNTAETTGTSMGSPSTDFQTNALTASGLITANDGIDIAGGTITIPNSTANNQPVALGQILSSAPISANNSASATTTISCTSTNFVAPSNGQLIIFAYAGWSGDAITSTNYVSNPAVVITTSLSGFVSLTQSENNQWGGFFQTGYLPMTSGQSTSITASSSLSSSPSSLPNVDIHLMAFWQPNP